MGLCQKVGQKMGEILTDRKASLGGFITKNWSEGSRAERYDGHF
ncbi:hypothetical protein YE105_C0024 [Yersinia enterocolitica subsp. palearctica 105.5R(r)]|nr:hypothetical protein YE105_C0024 [Yersinia enterocolitica subsp. palearctica 105.5R(r)]